MSGKEIKKSIDDFNPEIKNSIAKKLGELRKNCDMAKNIYEYTRKEKGDDSTETLWCERNYQFHMGVYYGALLIYGKLDEDEGEIK